MLASVKLNQMVRPSGHTATRISTSSMGARKVQAVRVLLFMGGFPRFRRSERSGASNPGPFAAREIRSPRAALDLLELAFELLQAVLGRGLAREHVVRGVPEGRAHLGVLGAGGRG